VTLTGLAEFKNYHWDSPESVINGIDSWDKSMLVTSHINLQIIFEI
jgi:hypothetical protein